MAGILPERKTPSPSEEKLISHEDGCKGEDPKTLLTSLIFELCSAVETTKRERDQLRYQIDCMTKGSEKKKNEGKVTKKQAMQAKANLIPNLTDSGIGTPSDNGLNLEHFGYGIEEEQLPNSVLKGATSKLVQSTEISNFFNSSFPSTSNQDQRNNIAQSNIECDGNDSVFLQLQQNYVEDTFRTELRENETSHRLLRATSSRQGEKPAIKNTKGIKKNDSYESYFPIEPDRAMQYHKTRQRRSSYSLMTTLTPYNLSKGDISMKSILPQAVSKTILNNVTRELRRVRNEYDWMKENEEKMIEESQDLQYQVESLKTEMKEKEKVFEAERKKTEESHKAVVVNLMKEKEKTFEAEMKKTKENHDAVVVNMMKEKEKAFEAERMKTEESHNAVVVDLLQNLGTFQKKLEKKAKLNDELEKMLKDERRRFLRDEENWKEKNETLLKQVNTHN